LAERKTKLVPVSEEDLERLREAANAIGVPFRELVARVFRDGARLALLSGGRISEVEAEYRALKELGRVGFALVPVSTLNKALARAESLEEALRDAWEVGKSVGTLYRVSGASDEGHVIGFVRALFPDSSQASLRREGDSVTVTVVAVARSRESMLLASRLLDGFMESLGYSPADRELAGGLLVARYAKRSEERRG